MRRRKVPLKQTFLSLITSKGQGIMLHNKLLPFALLALTQSIVAAQTPTAGSQLKQIPPPPSLSKPAPEIRIEPSNSPARPGADDVKIMVKSLHVTCAHAYSEAELVAFADFQPGNEQTLYNLRAMALKISDEYHRNGYFVAQAYLPAQDIKDGVVTIAVIEGQYGKVTVHNQANLPDRVINSRLAGIQSGDVVTRAPLENGLLRVADLPGANVKSTLVPGATAGTSDLIVDVTPGARVSGEVDADNAGNRYTGEYRLGATVNLNNPLGLGDVASLRVMTSGEGLNYARLSYQMPVGKATVGVAYSKLRYKLGKEFESLHANGTADIASIYGSYPLIRSRDNNLYAQLGYDERIFQDKVDSTASVTDKKAHVLMASLSGDQRDSLGRGGASAYSLTWSAGLLDIQTPSARAFDDATAQSNGHYNKLAFSAMRLQNVTDSVSLYAGVNGQLASKNLDVSEKMELGGMYAVRAYPEGEAFADQGYVLSLEARLLLPKFSERQAGQMHLIGFVDTGTVTVDKDPWTAGSNSRTLSGAGVGFTWVDNNDFSVKAYYAHKLGNAVATSAPDKNGRLWVQVVKYF